MIKINLIENLIIKFKLIFSRKVDRKKIAVIDEGKDSLYLNCEGTGPDGGLLNKGKNNKFINSKWKVSKK